MPGRAAGSFASVQARPGVPVPPKEPPAHPLLAPPVPPLALTPWFLPQQMDDAVYTFETLLHQELGKLQGKDDLCKSIQRILERVLKVRAGGCSCTWDPPVAFTRG